MDKSELQTSAMIDTLNDQMDITLKAIHVRQEEMVSAKEEIRTLKIIFEAAGFIEGEARQNQSQCQEQFECARQAYEKVQLELKKAQQALETARQKLEQSSAEYIEACDIARKAKEEWMASQRIEMSLKKSVRNQILKYHDLAQKRNEQMENEGKDSSFPDLFFSDEHPEDWLDNLFSTEDQESGIDQEDSCVYERRIESLDNEVLHQPLRAHNVCRKDQTIVLHPELSGYMESESSLQAHLERENECGSTLFAL